MTIETLDMKIGDIVREDFRTASVFQTYGMDFCCGGGQSLESACAKSGVDAAVVARELEAVSSTHDAMVPDFKAWRPDVLIEHIVSVHHAYVARMLPVVLAHAQKVGSVHGANHPETIRIAELFTAVANELEHHMFKEEQVLFPYIVHMVKAKAGEASYGGAHFGTVRNPIRMMEAEHESAGTALAEIRAISGGLVPPADACTTYRVLYQELDAFERDLHQHIHLENNILHPRAIELETELLGATA